MGGAGRRAAAATATAMMIVGGVLATHPLVERLSGEWRQFELAAANDVAIPRYRNAVSTAYGVLVEDFEDALVSYEVGGLPTGADGREIELPRAVRPTLRSGITPGVQVAAAAGPPPAPAPSEASPASSSLEPALPETIIRIPKIGLSQAIVEGVSRDHLKDGPGHYPGTALPGERGNVVISGHRTTYTAPFLDLDLLVAGDEIVLDTPAGSHRYLAESSYVVSPDDVSLLAASDRPVLTLTTCTPKGSARSRLIVVGVLAD